MQKALLFSFVCFLMISFKKDNVVIKNVSPFQVEETLSDQALEILEQKCNACHLKKKRVVFTEKNMNSHGRPIYYQVFHKKRMPKGKVKLTEREYSTLYDWIESLGCRISF